VLKETHIGAAKETWDAFRTTRLLDRFNFRGTQQALGFAKRSDNYMKRKGKRGKLAHVFTGRTKAAAGKATTRNVTAKRGGIAFNAGNQYGRRKPGNIDLREEIERLSAADKKLFLTTYEKAYIKRITAALNDPKNLKKTTTKRRS
jgi:hypothetical protein